MSKGGVKMGILEMINKYTDSIVRGEFAAPDGICKNCRNKPERFTLHECRKRQVRLIIKNIVRVLLTLLPRWKCSICGVSFTQYPPFILPHKRFVLTDIRLFGLKYLTNKDSSYADVVKNDGDDIGYPNESGLCDHFLSPSSAWRFMGYLAGASNSEVSKKIPGKPAPIPSIKHRSDERKSLLQRAFKAIVALAVENSNIFPDFETSFT
jgi:hypothetical protein